MIGLQYVNKFIIQLNILLQYLFFIGLIIVFIQVD